MKRPAIFLDRDGTLNVDTGYTHRVADLQLIPHAVAGLQRLHALGYPLFIVTNQSGIARGLFSERQMHEFNDALCLQLNQADVPIAGVYHCPFHPTKGIGEYRRESHLRKPAPGMLLQAAREHQLDLARSFAIGDKQSDVLAAAAAGCRGILVRTGQAGQGEPHLSARAAFTAEHLIEAADYIEQCGARFAMEGRAA